MFAEVGDSGSAIEPPSAFLPGSVAGGTIPPTPRPVGAAVVAPSTTASGTETFGVEDGVFYSTI
jgi:hypothetical protein